MVKLPHWRMRLLLSGSELHLSAGPALLRHRFPGAAGRRLPAGALHLLPAHSGLLHHRRAAGGGGGGRGALSPEGAQLQAPPAACHLLLPSIQKLNGAGHQPPRAPPPHRRIEEIFLVVVVCIFFIFSFKPFLNNCLISLGSFFFFSCHSMLYMFYIFV